MSEEKDSETRSDITVFPENSDAETNEGENNFGNLFLIAADDLECSAVLYDNKYYSQSVFSLQQSVEKASKSFGLFSGMVAEKDLNKKIGHKPLAIYKKPANQIADQLIRLSDNFEDYPEFKRIIDSTECNFDQFAAFAKTSKHSINEFLKNVADHNLSEEKLDEYIGTIKQFNKEFDEAIDKIIKEKAISQKFPEIKESLLETLESAIKSLKISDEQKDIALKEIRKAFDSVFFSAEYLEYILFFIFCTIRVGANLFYLSVITSEHAIRARYPAIDFNPMTFYSEDLPLIKRMDEIQSIARDTLEDIDQLYVFTMNPPEFLQKYSENSHLVSETEAGENPNEQ